MRRVRPQGSASAWIYGPAKGASRLPAAEVTARLEAALAAHLAGERCHCGEPIWVIGSAEAGHTCFTCITGEVDPSEDYELAEALDARAALPDRRKRRHGQR